MTAGAETGGVAPRQRIAADTLRFSLCAPYNSRLQRTLASLGPLKRKILYTHKP
jgi:hypothetical protein